MCTVMLRLDPGARWPLLVAAVRDEFTDRAWDPPAAHWPEQAPGVVGGRDQVAGGTWLAVRSDAVAALLNGVRLTAPASVRPTRGALPLAVLTGTAHLDAAGLAGYDGFHLLLATRTSATVWTWDGVEVRRRALSPGNHIIVNDGIDVTSDPLVPHFLPLLSSTGDPDWPAWQELVRGDGLTGDDPRALIVARHVAGRSYGSTSASLIGLPAEGPGTFRFTATPARPAWYEVPVPA